MNPLKKLFVITFLIFVFLVSPQQSHATFSYYRSVTATSSATAIPAQQSNFPALVDVTLNSLKTTSTDSTNGRIQNVNGYDIGFGTENTCSSGKINYERENYVSSTGEFEAWVPITSLSTSTVIYMCYGNSSVSTDPSSSTAPWDSNYLVVHHMADNAASTTVFDSTNNANYSVSQSHNTSVMSTTTQVDGGFKLNGTTDFLKTHANVSVSSSTYSIWVLPISNPPSYGRIMETNYGNDGYLGITNTSQHNSYYFIVKSGSGSCNGESFGCAYGGSAAATTTWHYLTGSYDGTKASLYIDGSLVASDTVAAPSVNAQPLYTSEYYGGGAYYWPGKLDEERLSNIARSASWIATDYWTQFATGTAGFWSVGAEQSSGGGGGGATNAIQNAMAGGILQCSNSTLQVANATLQVQ